MNEACFRGTVENGVVKTILGEVSCNPKLVIENATSTPAFSPAEHMGMWTVIIVVVGLFAYRTFVRK